MWPTIRSTDADHGGRGDLIQAMRGNPNSHYRMWPTPNVPNGGRSVAHVTDWRGKSAYHNGKKVQVGLESAVKMWPTPQARDHFPPHKPEYIAAKKAQGHGMSNLNDAVAHYPTPTARDWRSGKASPETMARNSRPLSEIIEHTQTGQPTPPKRLNPAWVEWLMGVPHGWTDLKPLAMDKFREWLQQHSPRCIED